jgi:formylglycine-generating enzyme required for sulfatase activity
MVVLARLAAVAVVVSAGLVRGVEAQECCTGNVSTYCTAGTSVQGCVPQISGVGVPSMNATSGFDVVVDNVPTQKMGLIFYGLSAIPQPQPWALGSSSYLCIFYPVNRTGAQNSGGSEGACDGDLRVDFNAWRTANPTALGSPFGVGQVIYAQGWYRDSGAAKGTNLGDALVFNLCSGEGDTVPPVITTCAPNQSIGTSVGCQGVVPDFTASVVSSDNCTPVTLTQLPAAGASVALGTLAVTITATDAAGNTAQCVALLTVTDTTGPMITACASNQSVAANGNCRATVPDFTQGVVASDACGGAVSLSQSPAAGTLTNFGVNSVSVTVTATDSVGNTSTCAAMLSVTLPAACQALPGFVVIQPGTFLMGSNAATGYPYFPEAGWPAQPVRTVTISNPFWIGETEVTQAQYSALMGTNPSWFQDANRPVEQVSWFDAHAYCAALTAQQSAVGNLPPGYQYRLPTEAEWEYACRAGTTTEFNVGPSLFCHQAKFRYSEHSNSFCSSGGSVQVGSYPPNAWGLHDMHGNVWEFCLDSAANYVPGQATDPFVAGGAHRIARGGASGHWSGNCRSAHRDFYLPTVNQYDIGFRVVLAPILVP